jgi:hypothetical protein
MWDAAVQPCAPKEMSERCKAPRTVVVLVACGLLDSVVAGISAREMECAHAITSAAHAPDCQLPALTSDRPNSQSFDSISRPVTYRIRYLRVLIGVCGLMKSAAQAHRRPS